MEHPSTPFDKKNVRDITALTPMQEGMLFHYLKEPEATHYVEQLSLHITGPADETGVEKAWNLVIENNDMLRTVFRWEKVEKPVQVVLKQHRLKPRFHDLTGNTKEEIHRQLEVIKTRDRLQAFDLREVPFRVTLCKLDENEWDMIVCNHHILYDGWSTGILLKEFFYFHHLFSQGLTPRPAVKPPFKSFVRWLRRQKRGDREKTFWKNYLAGIEGEGTLSFKRRGNTAVPMAKETKKTACFSYRWPEELSQKLRALAKERRWTVASLLYAAWGLLLARYNDSSGVLLGTTVSGRTPEIKGIEEMVGLFINTVPMGVRLSPGDTVEILMEQITRQLTERRAFEFSSLVDIKEYYDTGSVKKEELFDSLVVIENYPLDNRLVPEGCGLSIRSFSMAESTHYDLTLGITAFDVIEPEIAYGAERFDEEVIKAIPRHLERVLNTMVLQPGARLDALEILGEEEKRQLLSDFNGTVMEYRGDKSLFRLFGEQVEKNSGAAAVTGPGREGFTSLTYGELDRLGDITADWLRRRGIGTDTIVAILGERCIETVIGILGILKAGGAYLPISPHAPVERVRYLLKDSGAGVLILPKELKELKGTGKKGTGKKPGDEAGLGNMVTLRLREFLQAGKVKHKQAAAVPVAGVGPSDAAYIIYTSGTTGRPKGVILEQRGVVNVLTWYGRTYRLKPGVRVLQFNDFSFDPSVEQVLGTLLHGAEVSMPPAEWVTDLPLLREFILKRKINLIDFVPRVMGELLDTDVRFPSLRTVIVGGEALEETVKDRILSRGYRLFNHYGPTETTIEALTGKVSSGMVTLGKPVANMRCYIVNRLGQPCPVGVPGEILISGDGIARGYLNRPELTSEKFILSLRRNSLGSHIGLPVHPSSDPGIAKKGDRQEIITSSADEKGTGKKQLPPHPTSPVGGPGGAAPWRSPRRGPRRAAGGMLLACRYYRTGDLGRWLPGGVVEFLGRMDGQVKVRGYRVELGEVERRLLDFPGVTDAVVVACEGVGGTYLCGYYVLARGVVAGVAEMKEYLGRWLPGYMVPERLMVIGRVPRTASGKVDRGALPALDDVDSYASASYVPPGTPMEKELAGIWAQVLGVESVCIDRTFFELGGNSFSLMRLSSKLEKETGRRVPVAKLFQFPTVRGLAGYLGGESSETGGIPAAVDEKKPVPADVGAGVPGSGGGGEKTGALEIAVIGMAGRFPGADNINRFWENLKAGTDSVCDFSDEELRLAGVPEELLNNPDYIKTRAILQDIESFDAHFFDYTPAQAAVTDPQVRLFHQCCWEALEDAGRDPDEFPGVIGIYGGSSENIRWVMGLARGALAPSRQYEILNANSRSFVSLTAYKLNLRGPAVTLDTACSTSLTALDAACRAIRAGHCDMALAGGVSVYFPHKSGYLYQQGMILSPGGRCRTFDAGADGIVAGEGVGMVVLRPLQAALTAGDRVYAVIEGIGVNNDGSRKIGYSAPSVEGQREVIKKALHSAGVEASTIGYIETHGTGTPLGDPVEIEALKLAFGPGNPGACGLGSVKTNMGHLDAAAGITGFIKAVLAVKEGYIPPSIHFKTPNPKLDLVDSPFYVAAGGREWSTCGLPRRAGVSSLGIGGTNVHVVLEEAPRRGPRPATGAAERPYTLLLLSARTEAALQRMRENLAAFLKTNPGTRLADVAYTLSTGRRRFEFREALVCDNKTRAHEVLAGTVSMDSNRPVMGFSRRRDVPAVFMFPGRAEGYAGMGRGLYRFEPLFREAVDRCAAILAPILGADIREILYPATGEDKGGAASGGPPGALRGAFRRTKGRRPLDPRPGGRGSGDEGRVHTPKYAQPALFTFRYALAFCLTGWGIRPQGMIGRDGGEINAAHLAGVFSLEDALKLAAARGRMLQGEEPGALEAAAREVTFHRPELPFISGLTGGWINGDDAVDPGYWVRQAGGEENFSRGLEVLLAGPDAVFFEAGPGNRLSAMVRQHAARREGHGIINLVPEPGAAVPDHLYLTAMLGRMWVSGCRVDWRRYHGDGGGRKIWLPHYPFEKQRFPVNDRVFYFDSVSAVGGNPTGVPEAVPAVVPIPPVPKGRPPVSALYKAPSTELEHRLTGVWEQLFGFEGPGIADNFYELGGDSLRAITLCSMVRQELKVEFPLTAIFDAPTIGGMARFIETQNIETGNIETQAGGIEPAEGREYYPPAPEQQRIYMLHHMDPGNSAYNMPVAFIVEGEPDREKLETVFRRLIRRHESLRTGFFTVNEEPFQFISRSAPFALETPGEITDPVYFARPFDLSLPPLLRAGLIPWHEGKHLLLTDFHHIIADGTSMGIFIEELLTLYGGGQLEPLTLAYRDYTVWRHSEPGLKRNAGQRAYWLERFDPEPPVLELPYDFSRPREKQFAGAVVWFQTGAGTAGPLKALARAEGATLFMVLSAVWNVLLSRLGNSEDIVVGTAASGRVFAELQPLMGMFVKTLPLRNFPRHHLPFREFLREVRAAALQAFENQEYPFEELVEQLHILRDPSRNPLFDIMLVHQSLEPPELAVPGLTLVPYREVDNRGAKFDMILEAEESGEDLGFRLEYATALFKEETVRRFIVYFQKLLAHFAVEPDLLTGEAEMLPDREKRRLLEDLCGSAGPGDISQTITGLFNLQVEQNPDRIAAGGPGELVLTYGELDRRARCLARYLFHQGAGPGSIVGLTAERSVDMIVGIMGIIRAGCAYLPMDPGYPPERIDYMTADSGIRFLVTAGAGTGSYSGGPEVIGIREVFSGKKTPSSPVPRGTHVPHPSDPIYVIYTSGTTGKPKGTLVTHGNVVRLVHNTNYLSISPRDRILQVSSFAFDGSVFDIFGALANGAALMMLRKEDIPDTRRLASIIEKRRITMFLATTALFNALVDTDIGALTYVRKVFFGGEQVSVPHCRKVLDHLGPGRLVHLYGPTEAAVCATYHFIDAIDPGRDTIPIGRPLSNTTVYLLDRHGRPVPMGVPGEIVIGGPAVARGYLNRPELTAERFAACNIQIPNPKKEGDRQENIPTVYNESSRGSRGSPSPTGFISPLALPAQGPPEGKGDRQENVVYKTGDLGRMLGDGSIEFTGRIDQQVKIRGFRIEPGEIENILAAHESVLEAVVMVRESKQKEKYLCAYYLPGETASTPAADSLEAVIKEYLAAKLPGYMVPAYFIALENMPLTPNGKIDRKALPEPETGAAVDFIPPSGKTETVLARLWSEVLLIPGDTVGRGSDFFRLGGHSLKATVLGAKIHKAFNVQVPLTAIFSSPTLEAMARTIGISREESHVSIPLVEEREYYPLSSTQARLFILQQMETAETAYNMPVFISLPGDTDLQRLQETFRRLIQRHQSLRTSFHMLGDQPVQKIHAPETIDFQILHLEPGAAPSSFIRPFDLSQPPLLRAAFFPPSAPCPQPSLLIDLHHIISDGVSQEILSREFTALYGGENLPPQRLQYKDYAYWQTGDEYAGRLKTQEAYWVGRFSDELPILELPLDFPRPAVQGFEGATLEFPLPEGQLPLLRQLARDNECTLFMVLFSSYVLLLSYLSGQEDIIAGTPVANRTYADLEEIIGMFVNTIPLRLFPEGNLTFTRFLSQAKTVTLEAYENQEYPLEELVDRVWSHRDAARNPLFDTVLVLQNLGISEEFKEAGDSAEKSAKLDFHDAKFDLTLTAEEWSEELRFSLNYCTRLFTAATTGRFARYFTTILTRVTENPETILSEIDILSNEEKHRLLYDFNDTAATYPQDATLHGLFGAQVERTPENRAVVGGGEKKISLTYRELNDRAADLALELREKGVGPDTIVALITGRNVGMLVGVFGILKAGGAYMPIDPQYPQDRIEYMLNDSGTKHVVTGERRDRFVTCPNLAGCHIVTIPSVPGNLRSRTGYKPVRTSVKEMDSAALSSSLAYVIYTSGTTGRPKGVLIGHYNVVRLMVNDGNLFDFNDKDVWTLFHSYCFDFSVWEMYGALLFGGRLMVVPRDTARDTVAFLTLLEEEGVTVLNQTPSAFYNLVAEEMTRPADRSRRPCPRYIIFGGEALNPVKIKEWHHRYPGSRFINMYGITETTVHVTYKEVTGSDMEHTLSNIGVPIPTLTAYVMRGERLVPLGTPGELVIGGKGVARGYLNRPGLTAEKFPSGHAAQKGDRQETIFSPLYRSGDLVRWLPNGDLEYLGRIDQQVKIRGFRIELGEIENRLMEHPMVSEALVITREDRGDDSYLCGYIISGQEIPYQQLKDHLLQSLPEYMVPSFFVPLDRIPLTPNGKIDRKGLPAPVMETSAAGAPPRDDMETALAELWTGLLGLGEPVMDIDADFFALGGHSLKAAVLVSNIHKQMEVKIDLAQVFTNPTIRGMAELVRVSRKEAFETIPPAERRGYYPLSPAQNRQYTLELMVPGTINYNIFQVFRLEGKPDRGRLEQAFKDLIQRHESLRTSFHIIDEQPAQVIHDRVDFSIDYYRGGPSPRESISQFIQPFDLSRAPLLRVGIFTLPSLFIIDMHHIITDGVSTGILVKDFMSLYAGETLPRPRIQYKDYAQWMHIRVEQGLLKQQESYWLEVFSGQPPAPELPMDFKRETPRRFDGAIHHLQLPPEKTGALKQLAAHEGVSLFMLLMGIFYVFLSKITGHEDLAVGTVTAGRGHADLEPVIGMFVNTLALRNCPQGKLTFREFLQDLRAHTLEAFRNQDYPFEELVEQLDLNRDMSRNPLFDTMFSLQNQEAPELRVQGPVLIPYDYDPGIAKFDLLINGMEEESAGVLHFYISYSTALFKPGTMERLAGYFEALLTVVPGEPGALLSGLCVLNRSEREQVLRDFNRTVTAYPRDKTLDELFEIMVEKYPGRIALVGPGGHGTALSYGELNRRANRLAHVLKSRGAGADGVIALMADRLPAMIIGIMAILKAGGAYLPLSKQFPAARVRYLLRDGAVLLLLTHSPHTAELRRADLGLEILDMENPVHKKETLVPSGNPSRQHNSSHLCYVIYTSGTTGRPKGTLTIHRNVSRVVLETNYIDFTPSDRVLQLSNVAFDGSVFDIYGALLNGGALVLVSGEDLMDVHRLGAWIKKQGVTVFFITAALFNALVELEISSLRHVRKVLAGGERLSVEHVRKALRYLGAGRVVNGYGPTEATVFATSYPVERLSRHLGSIPIGKPVSNTVVYILDSYFNPVPIGVPGEIYIGGPGVARGYLNRPELTSEKFILLLRRNSLGSHIGLPLHPSSAPGIAKKGDRQEITTNVSSDPSRGSRGSLPLALPAQGPPEGKDRQEHIVYKTGDIGKWLPDGNILFLDRVDQQVKLRGFRIEMGEIENRLLSYPGVREAAVVLRGEGDHYLCAYYVSREELEPAALKEHLLLELPEYMVPSYFLHMESFPLTANKKLDVSRLPGPGAAAGRGSAVPETPLQIKLAAIWEEVLGVENPGLEDDFFRLRGHSLKATLLVSRIHREFQVRIPMTEIFRVTTLGGQAALIAQSEHHRFEALVPVEEKEYYPLSAAQKRFYFQQVMNPETITYNIPCAFTLRGSVDRGRLQDAFRGMVERHEAFRTAFIEVNGAPVQRIFAPGDLEWDLQYSEVPEGTKADVQSLTAEFVRPFVLSRPPLLRVALVRLSGAAGTEDTDAGHLLLLDLHHIIGDGVTTGIITREFFLLYGGETLPPPAFQYKDFSHWQGRMFRSGLLRKQETYWLDVFHGELPELPMPLDFPRPAVRDLSGACLDVVLEEPLTAKVRQMTERAGVTVYQLFLAVYALLLHKYTGRTDIITGSPVSGRRHAGLEHIVGVFVNMMAPRLFPEPGKKFSRFLGEVKQAVLEAQENQDYPFEQLVDRLGIRGDASRNPLFDAGFLYFQPEQGGMEEAGFFLTPVETEHRSSRFDMLLGVNETGERLSLGLEFSTQLFKAGSMEKLLGHYLQLLEQVVEDPGKPIEEYSISLELEEVETEAPEISFNF